MNCLISARREDVLQSYNSAVATNRRMYLEGDDRATEEYIYANQAEDAYRIVDAFYSKRRRVVSIQKKTKVGADGLMIEVAKLLTTHIDDAFVVNPANVRILTGMSNAGWEKDMIDKAPGCFKEKIFHHGKLSRAELSRISNSLIIIDEIDTGDKEFQVLHTTLKEAGVLDVLHMEAHNNRFLFISATMIKELYCLYQWGELHELYQMTIPSSYFGHADFLRRGVLQEFYPLLSQASAEKWVQEDVVENYGADFRVHIVRVSAKSATSVQNACIRKGVAFRNHTSADRLSGAEIKEFFKTALERHVVLGVKGFFRRANLIPNRWKLRIGATHEYHTSTVDNNVQIQGLVGRMTGYWRGELEGGHKTGPHRTSIQAIHEYEKTYHDPFGLNCYQTAGFHKRAGKVSVKPTMFSAKHIGHLVPVDLPLASPNVDDPRTVPVVVEVTKEEYAKFKKKRGGHWDEKIILAAMSKYNPALVEKLQTLQKLRIVECTCTTTNEDAVPATERVDDKSYKMRITDFVQASQEEKKRTVDTCGVTKDVAHIYLDKVSHRLVVSVFYGSMRKTQSERTLSL